MNNSTIIFDDDVSAIAMMEIDNSALPVIAIRWLPPKPYEDKNGNLVAVANNMGGETDWFILPHTFATGVCKQLVELKVTGMYGFNEEGFSKMVDWLTDLGDLVSGVSY